MKTFSHPLSMHFIPANGFLFIHRRLVLCDCTQLKWDLTKRFIADDNESNGGGNYPRKLYDDVSNKRRDWLVKRNYLHLSGNQFDVNANCRITPTSDENLLSPSHIRSSPNELTVYDLDRNLIFLSQICLFNFNVYANFDNIFFIISCFWLAV